MVDQVPADKNIYQRMNDIMNECAKIDKKGYNSFGRYNYIRAVDVIGHISKLLVKHGVNMTISENEAERHEYVNAKGAKNYFSKIKCTARFTNINDKEDYQLVEYFSISADSGDKDIFKAKTNGLKYLLSQTFMIVTNDFIDTEASNYEVKETPLAKAADDVIEEHLVNAEDCRPGPRYVLTHGGHAKKRLEEFKLDELRIYHQKKQRLIDDGKCRGDLQKAIMDQAATKTYIDKYLEWPES